MVNLEYFQALADDPKGKHCAICGDENSFYDDCGWRYVRLDCLFMAVCESCFNATVNYRGER